MELDDQHFVVLLGIRDIATYRDMGATLGRSIGHVQSLIKELFENELIERRKPDKVKATPWKLTTKGMEVLTRNGYHVFQ